MRTTSLLALATVTSTLASDILLVDFKGTDKAVTHKWRTNNDPVMGGQSYSTVAIENGLMNFTGSCKIVPSLNAPGFITVVNSDSDSWVDMSSCEGIKFNHRSVNTYKGFRVSFGTKHCVGCGFFARGFKADVGAPSVGEFGDAFLSFGNFTDDWSDSTGKPVKTCASDSKYCPDKASLENFKTMSIWAEGVEGDVGLEVSAITGYNCK
jgi:hypothetical protein